MSEAYSHTSHAEALRRLNLLWHGVLPGAIVVAVLAAYGWAQTSADVAPVAVASFAGYLPVILGTALLFGSGLTLFLKSRLPELVARNPASQPFQRVSNAMFVLLGAADVPAIIGIGMYVLAPTDWLAAAVVVYAFAAGMIFKPDFGALLRMERHDTAQ